MSAEQLHYKIAALVIITLIAGLAVPARGQTPAPPKEIAALLADFTREATRVKEPRVQALRAEGTKLAAKLTLENASAEAEKVGRQIEDKIAGKPVDDVRVELQQIFDAYDRALTLELKPVQNKYMQRIDALIRANQSRDLDMVVALAGAKKAITQAATELPGQPPAPPLSTVPLGTVVPKVTQLKGHKHDPTGQSWGIGTSGTLYTFLKNGRGERLDRGAKQPFVWKMNSKGQVELEGPNFRPRIIIFDPTATQGELFIVETGEKSGTLQHRK